MLRLFNIPPGISIPADLTIVWRPKPRLRISPRRHFEGRVSAPVDGAALGPVVPGLHEIILTPQNVRDMERTVDQIPLYTIRGLPFTGDNMLITKHASAPSMRRMIWEHADRCLTKFTTVAHA